MSKRSPITTHVLDVSRGKAAAEVSVLLERRDQDKKAWLKIKKSATNQDGRVEDLMSPKDKLEAGTYRLVFDIGAYFSARKTATLYPYASVVFEVTQTDQHYHIPLLLSPFGYSTYRGT